MISTPTSANMAANAASTSGLSVGIAAATYVKPPGSVPEPHTVVTTTSTGPGLFDGVTAVIVVKLTTTTPVAGSPPKDTVAGATKFVPLIVTAVPPVVGPVFGVTLVTVGRKQPP